MAYPDEALEHLDYQAPIPCYYVDPVTDPQHEGFSCDSEAHVLATWACGSGHRIEQPYCALHAGRRTQLPHTCPTCQGDTEPVFARQLPPGYWPGEVQ